MFFFELELIANHKELTVVARYYNDYGYENEYTVYRFPLVTVPLPDHLLHSYLSSKLDFEDVVKDYRSREDLKDLARKLHKLKEEALSAHESSQLVIKSLRSSGKSEDFIKEVEKVTEADIKNNIFEKMNPIMEEASRIFEKALKKGQK